MRVSSITVVAVLANCVLAAENSNFKYVGLFSVDGLHSSDVPKYVALRPQSTIAKLLQCGYEYQNAYTSKPSDSFPGSMNYATGASPSTTGVWYDDTWDDAFFPPYSVSGTNCSGPPGAEVVYDESIDYNSTVLFSGGINPLNLPQTIVNGKCVDLYPHQRVRVNTIFEVVHAAGLQTAWTDKHPAYDILRGPSGKGLSVGYFPEIAAIGSSVEATIAYDQLHVDAVLGWITNATTPPNSEVQDALRATPALFGANFQSVSVAQKTSGYENETLAFTPELLKALDFVDASIASFVAALQAKGIYKDTLLMFASKHGQAPIDPTKYAKVDPKGLTTALAAVKVDFITTDDVALVFLKNSSDVVTAVAGLNANRVALRIADIIYGPQLIAQGFGDPLKDTAVPDIIVVPVEGVIYTTSTKKIAEHGGLNPDDVQVACFVSSPRLNERKYPCPVSTRQVAPTVLHALGLNAGFLIGAGLEGTTTLNGFR